MKLSRISKLCLVVAFVPTVTSLIISSVYAGKKKFKTISFEHPFLPAIVKVQPNKFHLTFRQNKYLRTPQFKIEGTIPLKAPTVVKEITQKDPNPQVTEYNFGDMEAIKGVDQHKAYDTSGNYPVYAKPPTNMPYMPFPHLSHPPSPPHLSNIWTPIHTKNNHRIRRFADNNQYNTPPFFHNSNYGQTSDTQHNYPNYWDNKQNYYYPNNGQQNYYQNNGQYSGDSNTPNSGYLNGYQNPQHYPNFYPNYQSNVDMSASSSSYSPVRQEQPFAPSNHQNNKWVPIDSPPAPAAPMSQNSNSGYASEGTRKLNIGEHYNPSASYVDETVVEKPTYDPDTEPDEGSISFSFSGPHGGEEVPAGYEQKIKQMHEALKDEPNHLPPGLDMEQLSKYYTHHTFTDPLKTNYGYKASFSPLGFIKNKLKSWTKFI